MTTSRYPLVKKERLDRTWSDDRDSYYSLTDTYTELKKCDHNIGQYL